MILAKINLVKAFRHQRLQLGGLAARLDIGKENCMSDKLPFPQIEEARQEILACGIGGDINVGTPDLLENPSEQTERVDTSTKIGLNATLLQRTENHSQPVPHHLLKV